MMNWSEYEEQQQKHDRCVLRRIVIGIAAAVLLGLGAAYFAKQALAEPIMKLEEGGVKITLHTDDCQLKEVSNLPKRVTWEEGGKVIEGCWGLQPAIRVVMMYFSADKSVAVAPAQAFTRVFGA